MRVSKAIGGPRAISAVLAVLMVMVVSVTASCVTYAWSMGFIASTAERAGKAIEIQGISRDGDDLRVYVKNAGIGAVALSGGSSVYVDGVLKPSVIAPESLPEGSTAAILVAGDASGSAAVRVRVVTLDGTFAEATG